MSGSCKSKIVDLPTALHTAARAFCAERHSDWANEYMPLVRSGQDRVGDEYSKAAYSLFPRYVLDDAIQVEVERETGSQFRSLEDAHALLLDVGKRAFLSLLNEFERSSEARIALTDEWKAFEAYISAIRVFRRDANTGMLTDSGNTVMAQTPFGESAEMRF